MTDEAVSPFTLPPAEPSTEDTQPMEVPEYKEERPEDSEKDKCLTKIQTILAEHDGLESNIGHNDEYWRLVAKYRSL